MEYAAMQQEVKRTLLTLEPRRRIYDRIQEVPGIHVRRLQRDLTMHLGTLEHHLGQLERHGLVLSYKEGKKRSYFVRGQVDRNDLQTLYFLRHRTSRKVLLEVLGTPEITSRGLSERLGLAPATVSYHLKKLTNARILEPQGFGRFKVYRPVDPERLQRIFENYGSTFRPLSSSPKPAEAAAPQERPVTLEDLTQAEPEAPKPDPEPEN